MPIGNFPGNFAPSYTTVMSDTVKNLFEGPQVYNGPRARTSTLMIVEARGASGAGAYFRSSHGLQPERFVDPAGRHREQPLRGQGHSAATWTNDISHGDLIRTGPDPDQTIDPCNLQLLYQGKGPQRGRRLQRLPWRPGVLTLRR
ncbi:hypothetical protein GCM10023238_35490 [Streptomyces heliomycini]